MWYVVTYQPACALSSYLELLIQEGNLNELGTALDERDYPVDRGTAVCE